MEAPEADAGPLDAVALTDVDIATNVVTLAAGQTGPFALYLAGGDVFWATGNGSIESIATDVTDGALYQTLASSQGSLGGLTGSAGQLYWTNSGSGTIQTIPTSGGLPALLVSAQTTPTGIAVDGTSLYWATQGAGSGAVGAIWKAPLAGLQDGGTPTSLASGQEQPRNLTLGGGVLVWSTSSAVMKVPVTGGKATALAAGQSMVASIAVDANNVYFTTSDSLVRVPVGGGSPVTLVGGLTAPAGVASDGTNVYFLTGGDPTAVQRVPAVGGTVTTIDRAGPPTNPPLSIAVDATNVYWTVDNSAGGLNGLLEDAPK